MEESRIVGTPMVNGWKFFKEDKSVEMNKRLYKSMIGKLQYVAHRRIDISHAVGIVEIISNNPKETHMTTMKRIFRYMKGTKDYEWIMVQERWGF